MNWLYYLAEANLYLGVFYLAYCVLLSKETYYQLNRAYLLAGCVVAFIIPLVQLGFLKPVAYVVAGTSPVYQAAPAPAFTWVDALIYLYIAGAVFFAARFVLKLYQLKKLIDANPVTIAGNYKLVSLQGTDTAFSFFNYLFVGTQSDEQALITRHELVHIRQKHSVDIVFVELIQIISWFNPLVYLLQNSLKTVHEYVADEQTAQSETDTIAYATYLLNNAYGISGPAITHSFFNYNLLKKRITMLHQKRSGSLARLKYLVAAPLCAALLCQSTLGFSKDYALITIAPKAAIVVGDNTTDTIPAKKQKFVEVTLKEPANVQQLQKDKAKGIKVKTKAVFVTKSDGRVAEPKADIRIDEPKSEIRIDEPVHKEEIDNNEPLTEIRIDEPVQNSPKKLPVPSNPPLANKKNGVVKFPPPPPPLAKRNKNDVKFPPPIVTKDAPGKVPPPPPPAKPAKVVKFPPPIVTKN